MGDRVIVVVKDEWGYAPGVYMHWGGEGVVDSLKVAIPHLRKDDAWYSAARLCGVMHEQCPGNTGLGLLAPPDGKDWSGYSHGDAGVLVYDCRTGETTAYEGYLARDEAQTWPQMLPLPPA